ncbi:unnamed protein product [Penicillium roqueforti FM164]|uniref:Protein kinase-like domain n=1 Tax=Penicillium roqueforti (strain FM164) TaxID=1365484 RepID=W6QI35_PENRF|nr:unnamed protein product [Penicillium roqueforti FM164]
MTSVETRDHQLDRWLLMKIEHAIENLEEHKLNNTELKKWNIRFSSMTLDQNSDLKPRFFAPKPNLPLPNDEILDEAAEPDSGDDDYYAAAYGMNTFLDSYAFSQVGLWNDGPWRSMDCGRYSTYKSLWFYGTPSLGPSPAFGALTMIDSSGKEYPHFKAVIYTDMEADDKTCFRSEVLISLRLMLAQLRKVRLMHHKIAPVLLISLTGKYVRVLESYFDGELLQIRSTCLYKFSDRDSISTLYMMLAGYMLGPPIGDTSSFP